MKRITRVALAVAVVSLLFACGPAAPKTVKFGVFEPLTGANAGGGALEVEGVKLANELYPTVKVGD